MSKLVIKEFPWNVGYDELYTICTDWHHGQTSAMYSVSSTGTIHDADTLRGLASELRALVRAKVSSDQYYDFEIIRKWLDWTDKQADMLPDE